MKQLLQDARSGDLQVAEVPAPQLLPGCVLVRVAASLVSAGTERASAEFAGKNLIAKAKARPDLVRDVIAKVRRDGLISAMETVQSRLDQWQALGYSSAGRVIAVGEGVTDISPGDRVACAGAGYAVHAEVACVPRMLVAKIPQLASGSGHVSYEEAAFGTLGAVCLHGIRTAEVSLGEAVAVIGLGLLGQITVQLLKASGCRVFGMDLMKDRADLAVADGAESACANTADFRDLCFQKTGGRGVDKVLITAETASSEPVNLAAALARDRAIVVAVGTVGMELQRKLYYEKELDFRVSRSYGPGRYDTAYEQKGRDYPIGHVRWTETRNMEAFLKFIAAGKLKLSPLVTHRFAMDEGKRAYDVITGRSGESFLGVVIEYGSGDEAALAAVPLDSLSAEKIAVNANKNAGLATGVGLGVVGAGNFAQSTLLPALRHTPGVSLVGVCNATGPRSLKAAQKFGFAYCSNSEEEIFQDANINAVVIATRHHLHARQTLSALDAGKAVFCEKPLCLNEDELAALVYATSGTSGAALSKGHSPLVMVGFNRRFAPMALEMKEFLSQVQEPLAIHYRVNAGYIPVDHWVNDPEQSGGRILGEVCHFVDFVCFLAGAYPVEVEAQSVGNPGQYSMDNVIATLKFVNGSVGTISYLANGDRAASKERVEVFGGRAVAILEDFRRLELVRNGRKKVKQTRWSTDKGHKAEMQAFVDTVKSGGPSPIPFEQIVGSTLATLRLQNSVQTGQALPVQLGEFVAAALDKRARK